VVWFPGLAIQITFPLEIFPQLNWVHAISAFINVYEIRTRTRLADSFGSSDEGMRNSDDHIARLYPSSHQCKSHRIRTAGEPNAVFRIAKAGEFTLEILHHRTADKGRRSQYFFKNRNQFCLQFFVQTYQVQECYFFVV